MYDKTSKDHYFSLINGDEKGIEKIYKLLFPKVLRFILKNNGREEDAEDIFQKTLIHLILQAKKKQVTFTVSFEAYLFIACRNQWYKKLAAEKKWVTKPVKEELLYEDDTLNNAIEEQEKWDLYRTVFETLSDNCKTVMKLFYKKLPYSVICKELGYNSESVARQRVFKCRAKLSSLIKKHPLYKTIMTNHD